LPTMLCAGTFAIGMGYVGFAVAPSLATACVAAVVGGVGNGTQWTSLISLVQRVAPRDLLGRLMGAVESLGALCRAIGLPLGGVLVAVSSPRVAFLIVGLGGISAVGPLLALSRRSLRAVPPGLETVAPTDRAPRQAQPLSSESSTPT
jgi:predicted MFS family arabinose efflux permease